MNNDERDRQIINNAQELTVLWLQAAQSAGSDEEEKRLAHDAEKALIEFMQYQRKRRSTGDDGATVRSGDTLL